MLRLIMHLPIYPLGFGIVGTGMIVGMTADAIAKSTNTKPVLASGLIAFGGELSTFDIGYSIWVATGS